MGQPFNDRYSLTDHKKSLMFPYKTPVFFGKDVLFPKLPSFLKWWLRLCDSGFSRSLGHGHPYSVAGSKFSEQNLLCNVILQ